jgi:hypothetical protein
MKTKIEHNPNGYFVYGYGDKGWSLIGAYNDIENAHDCAKTASMQPDDFKTVYYQDGQQITCEK